MSGGGLGPRGHGAPFKQLYPLLATSARGHCPSLGKGERGEGEKGGGPVN